MQNFKPGIFQQPVVNAIFLESMAAGMLLRISITGYDRVMLANHAAW